MTMKRRLTASEEFEMMKLVLDKFLWLGTVFAGWGLFETLEGSIADGVWFLIAGAVFMVLFAWIVLREFEHLR